MAPASGGSAEPLTHWAGEPLSAWRALWGVATVEAYERIGSTNDRAKELAADSPAPRSAVVIAHEQTAGRGRQGRRWHSAGGSGLWMSVVVPWPGLSMHVPLLVGLAVAEAVEEVAARVRVGIKWPNDLIVDGAKLGGILCEASPGAVVAGIGVNSAPPPGGFPATLATPATSLEAQAGMSVPVNTLASATMRRLAVWMAGPAERLTPDALDQLGGRDVLAGKPIRSEEHGTGVARGIEPDGALILERPDGSRVRVVAGTVRPA